MSIRPARYKVAIALGAVLVAAMALAPSPSSQRSTPAALASFSMGVNDYMAARARAIRDVPPAPAAASFAEIAAVFERQFRAVRRARADARPGNVFSDAVSRMFRRTIAFTLEEYGIDVNDLLEELRRDVPKGAVYPRVNAQFPWVRGAAMPLVLLDALPVLPAQLQYRLVDRDLVLLDVGLGLVVDILPNALRRN